MNSIKAENNREHILRTAEKLFAAKGFHATSVDSIAKSAGVNKALIYYYFKNKDDIILSLFRDMTTEMGALSGESDVSRDEPRAVKVKIAQEIGFLAERKQILALLLMETMKQGNDDDFLFRISDSIMQRELKARGFPTEATDETARQHLHKTLVHEFFTGIIPIAAFVVLRDKFCTYFGCDSSEIEAFFLDALENSHFESHMEPTPKE